MKHAVLPETTDSHAVSRGRGRPPLSDADIEIRRAKIIDAAARKFFEEGFFDTTLAAIGREVGVTRRRIYQLVGDKDELYRAACDRLRVQGPHYAFDIPLDGRTAREVLLHMAQRLIDHSFSTDLLTMIRAIAVEVSRAPEIVRDVIVSGKDGFVKVVSGIFGEMVDRNMIGAVDTGQAADLFYDVVIGARGLRAVLNHPFEPLSDADLGERIDMFLDGYLNRAVRR